MSAAGAASRDILIKKGATRIAGVNSKSIAIAKEPIDVTTDEDNGYRTLLSQAGTKTLDISFSGVFVDGILLDITASEQTQLLPDITLELPPVGLQSAGAEFSGSFYLNGMTVSGGGSDGAVEFDGTLQSSGPWVYTAGT